MRESEQKQPDNYSPHEGQVVAKSASAAEEDMKEFVAALFDREPNS